MVKSVLRRVHSGNRYRAVLIWGVRSLRVVVLTCFSDHMDSSQQERKLENPKKNDLQRQRKDW